MAFALTKFEARGIEIKTPSKKRGVQELCFTISALAADVDLDIGDYAGTFWTAAVANASTGALAAAVLAILQAHDDNVAALLAVQSEQLIDRIQAAAAAGTAYVLTVGNKLPIILCDAANGETSWYIVVRQELNDGIFPVSASYG